MHKVVILPVLATALLSTPGIARNQEQTIIVQAQRTELQRWSKSVTDELSAKLQWPDEGFDGPAPGGIVTIRFQRGLDGTPTGAVVSRGSGSGRLDHSALRSVQAMHMRQPLPAGMRADQVFEANVLFASSADEEDTQNRALRNAAAVHNDWFKEGRKVFAFNLGLAVSGRSH